MSLEDDDARVASLRAVAHPTRLRILSLLTGAEMSAAEIARELDMSQANASYHVRQLVEAGHLIETGREKVRGGTAKKYRYVAGEMPAEERERIPPEQRRPLTAEDADLMVEAYAQELRRRMRSLRPGGVRSETDAEMWVTPKVWEEVTRLVREASHLIHAEAQPPRTEGTIRVTMQTHLFEMEEGERRS